VAIPRRKKGMCTYVDRVEAYRAALSYLECVEYAGWRPESGMKVGLHAE